MSEPLPHDWPLDPPLEAPRRPVVVGAVAFDGELSRIMEMAGEVAFLFDPQRDLLAFDRHAVELLGVAHLSDITTGTAFQLRIAPEFRDARRNATVLPEAGTAAAHSYVIQYKFIPTLPTGSAPIYLEEQASWTLQPDGRPIARGVLRVITGRYLELERLRERSSSDGLTGLINRFTFLERLEASIAQSRQLRRPCALLIASVNGLGTINDTFGIEVGDEVLISVAKLLRRQVRQVDHVGRYGSNKFAILVHDCGPGTMRVVADRLIGSVARSTIEAGHSKLTASLNVGAVSLPEYATTAEAALTAASKALDRARGKRANSFVSYEPHPKEENTKRRNAMLADALICAIDEHRLSLELQPMVAARSGLPDHYECLLRMVRPDGGLVSAGEFMPIAEQLGIVKLLDMRAQELAVDLLKRYPAASLSLNVSGITAADNEWLVTLHRLTQGKRAILERLTVEITETAAIHDLDHTIQFVETIKDLGCKVAIDDFGVGYTNFRNLKALNADLVKIDGSFVRNVCHDRGDQVFIRSMVELARAFGMKTVAEWVGDGEIAEFLIEAGIDYLQGYHFGAPVEPERLLESAASGIIPAQTDTARTDPIVAWK